jgi:hypothetical protein
MNKFEVGRNYIRLRDKIEGMKYTHHKGSAKDLIALLICLCAPLIIFILVMTIIYFGELIDSLPPWFIGVFIMVVSAWVGFKLLNR